MATLHVPTGRLDVLAGVEVSLDPAWVSVPKPIEFPARDGRAAHALYYPPTNPEVAGPTAARPPPLLVQAHPGPTADAKARLDLRIQFFTSRGFAVVDVNYAGSTGYGRAYRERLTGQWGVLDVADCLDAARFLIQAGEVDGRRLVISGKAPAASRPCARSLQMISSLAGSAGSALPIWRPSASRPPRSRPMSWIGWLAPIPRRPPRTGPAPRCMPWTGLSARCSWCMG